MSPKAMRGDAPSSAVSPTIKTEAQQVLDELWSEELIPFALNVGKITKDSSGYTIHFYDSRISTVLVPATDPKLFKELVRPAVLDRVAKMSGPLTGWSTTKDTTQ